MPRVFQHFVKDIFAIIINTMIELKSVYHKIILEEGHDRNPRTKCEPTTNSVERKRWVMVRERNLNANGDRMSCHLSLTSTSQPINSTPNNESKEKSEPSNFPDLEHTK